MTIFNKLFEYQTLERHTEPTGERVYITPTGSHPSVTTILSATANNPGLESWRKFVGEAKANQIRDEATGLGSLMHEHLECHLEGVDRPRGNNLVRQMARNMADQIIEHGLVRVDEIWGIEAPLYYPERYAGTADLIGVHDGDQTLMDFKTTNKMKTKDMLTDYGCQLAAYAIAHDHLYGTSIDKGVIFMVSRNLEYKEFVFAGDEFLSLKEKWLSRVDEFFAKHHPQVLLS